VKKVKSSGREKWLKNTAICARLMKFWVGEGRNKRKVPQLSKCARGLCAWAENDQRDLEMSVGPSKSWVALGGYSSGTVGQAFLRPVGLVESLSVASSPCHSFFGVDKPN